MAAPTENEFSEWLSNKLQKINPDVDLEVFVSYLTSILETEDTDQEEKLDSIQGFLAEIAEDDLEGHCTEILKEWEKYQSNKDNDKDKKEREEALEQKLAQIREQQNQAVVKTKNASADDLARKRAILAQYGEAHDGESDPEDDAAVGGETGDGDDLTLEKNFNALQVSQLMQQQRDKLKAEAEQKRQKDKEDREKQKEKAKTRKEAEKKRTQKGERRR